MFVGGLSLGIGAAAPIGPVNIEMARRTLSGGFLAGAMLGCGAVSVDVCYLALSALSARNWATAPLVRWPLAIGGFLLLVYLGAMSLAAARRHLQSDPLKNPRAAPVFAGAYRAGLLMTLLNPMTLVFWFVVLPNQQTLSQDSRRDLPMIGIGVFIGTLSWVVGFCGVLSVLGRWRKNWWMALADGVGGVLLLALAIVGLWRFLHAPDILPATAGSP